MLRLLLSHKLESPSESPSEYSRDLGARSFEDTAVDQSFASPGCFRSGLTRRWRGKLRFEIRVGLGLGASVFWVWARFLTRVPVKKTQSVSLSSAIASSQFTNHNPNQNPSSFNGSAAVVRDCRRLRDFLLQPRNRYKLWSSAVVADWQELC
ncbi:uncharacterized protein LOC130945166 [Arachis stenosperma]|uniref:uncharacterized protein LOC130945166 n=1 Tax=Arachis stenosperma TaxID=217475 RepID=UPI0025AC5262|nr:uncharacterized protein LOC130945166 [Arachis stenosperma]